MKMQLGLKAAGLILAVACFLGASIPEGDMCAVESAVIHHMRPAGVTNPPTIREVVVEDGYAVALWVEGYAGGTATLKKRHGTWTILALSGGWNSVAGLIQDGVPKEDAEKLAKDLGMGQ